MSTPNAHQFSFQSIDGEDMLFGDYDGKVVLVVNTASQCGFTGQYKDLQTLYETYKDQGLVIVGVPSNQFGNQEPGDEDEIKNFITENYGITFPMTQKYEVRGDNAHPFFKWAAQEDPGFLISGPKWNFHKYLIDKNGNLYKSYGSMTKPSSGEFQADIRNLLES